MADRHILDDPSAIAALDPSGLFNAVEAFEVQCDFAVTHAASLDIKALEGEYDQVLLVGMGGSAVGGDYLAALFDLYGKCPFLVSRDYSIPRWVNERTLVICSSYSGETRETLAAFNLAMAQHAKVLAVTGGGRLAELAGKLTLLLRSGMAPRSALGFMLLGPLVILERLGLIELPKDKPVDRFVRMFSVLWGIQNPLKTNPAKQMAVALLGKGVAVYGLGPWQLAVAKRWKAQINENAKAPCFWNAFPEVSHNEILGWVGARPGDWAMVSLEDGTEPAEMRERRRFVFDSFPEISSHIVLAQGKTVLQKMLSLTLFGDYVSLYLAVLNGRDPGDIGWIEESKRLLEELGTISNAGLPEG